MTTTIEQAQRAILGAFDQHKSHVSQRIDELETAIERAGNFGGGFTGTKSLGNLIAENSDFRAFCDKATRSKVSVDLNTGLYPGPECKSITSSGVGSSTPGILVPQRQRGIVAPGIPTFRVRDLLTVVPCGNNAVEFVRENVYTSAASPTNEGSAAPESDMTFEIDFENVRTVSHFVTASRNVLDDFTGLAAYLDGRLIDGLRDVEDEQILLGDGTGQNLSGLSTEATDYDTDRNVSGDTRIDKLNHAIAQLEASKMKCSGFVLNSSDWRSIQLTKTNEGTSTNQGQYILGGPGGMTPPMLWGVGVAVTTACPAGSFFALDGRYVILYDRLEASVEASTEHSDYFTKRLVALLAAERLALTVQRSDSILYGSY